MADIVKAAGIIIQDRKLLFVRSFKRPVFMAPGGKPDEGESLGNALMRELNEELGITVGPDDFEPFGVYERSAAGQPGKTVMMHCYLVHRWEGELKPGAEIAEMRWLSSVLPEDIQVASIFGQVLLPELVRRSLVD